MAERVCRGEVESNCPSNPVEDWSCTHTYALLLDQGLAGPHMSTVEGTSESTGGREESLDIGRD